MELLMSFLTILVCACISQLLIDLNHIKEVKGEHQKRLEPLPLPSKTQGRGKPDSFPNHRPRGLGMLIPNPGLGTAERRQMNENLHNLLLLQRKRNQKLSRHMVHFQRTPDRISNAGVLLNFQFAKSPPVSEVRYLSG